MEKKVTFQTKSLSSLSKVFADEAPLEAAYTHASALKGESFAFQIAYTSDQLLKNIGVEVTSTLGLPFTIRAVGLVPSEMPCYADHDPHVIRTTPGLYPDPLYPLEDSTVTALSGQWRSVWIHVELDSSVLAGTYNLHVGFISQEGEKLSEEVLELTVLAATLPKQKLIHTEWFHTDCLATHYNIPVFSEEHWSRIGQFLETAVKHGINMILTPIFTPPLDTVVGGERPTVQLIDVSVDDGKIDGSTTYAFGFTKLERWVALCQDKGVEYFEFSHLFTQWGLNIRRRLWLVLAG